MAITVDQWHLRFDPDAGWTWAAWLESTHIVTKFEDGHAFVVDPWQPGLTYVVRLTRIAS